MGGGTRIFFGSQRGGPVFFQSVKGGTRIFCACRGGGAEFFCACQGGDQKKLVTSDHKQTAPLPVKNDSSLKCLLYEILNYIVLNLSVFKSFNLPTASVQNYDISFWGFFWNPRAIFSQATEHCCQFPVDN